MPLHRVIALLNKAGLRTTLSEQDPDRLLVSNGPRLLFVCKRQVEGGVLALMGRERSGGHPLDTLITVSDDDERELNVGGHPMRDDEIAAVLIRRAATTFNER